jgi:hypothetical protein
MRGCTCHGLTLCAWCQALAARAVGSGVAGSRGLDGGDTPAIARPHLSEAAWQAAVIELAKTCGYLVYFTKDSRRSPSGYPDICCAKAGAPLILAELKTDTGQLTRAQEAWLAALAGSTGVVSAVWKPSMWTEIVEQLRGAR